MTYSSVVRKAVALPSLDLKTGNRPDLSVHPTLLPTPPATPPPKTDAKRLTENEEKFNEAVVKLEEEDGGESVAVERLDLVGGRGRSVNIPTDKDIEMYGLPMKRSWSCDGGERLRWEDGSDYDSDEEDA